MTLISFVSAHPVAATAAANQSLKAVALVCCCGLAASFGLIALGVNLGAAWA